MIDVKIKRLDPKAVIPAYAKPGDAGMDITAISRSRPELNRNGYIITYYTGLAFEIPEGYYMDLRPRSSIFKTALQLTNGCGVIDSGYRGEIVFKFRDTSNGIGKIYEPGDRIGQAIIIPYPKVNFIEVEELSETERSTGGFGSTDNEQNKEKNT